MKLTRGEFCQFNLTTRWELLREFGNNILERQVSSGVVSVYRIFDFYVEVYLNLSSERLEKVEPVRNLNVLRFYQAL